ncbi:hypothetical protein Dimus_034411 [Dionaea muscipula]
MDGNDQQQPLLLLFFNWLNLLICLSVLFLGLRVAIVLWWRPRRLEAHFGKQGIRGPPYQFLIGNVKELAQLMLNASSHPMPDFSHNILPRVFSFYHHWRKIYGPTFLVWFGPTARITVADPYLIREIFTLKSEFYEKIEAHPLVKQLEGDGLISLKGEKWAQHRKIITPAFHMENLKLLIPIVWRSVTEMLDKWEEISGERQIEIEVYGWFQSLTEDIMTRMAFGSSSSSYEDGKSIFQLHTQQMLLVADAYQKILIPGYRFLPTRRNLKFRELDKEIKGSLGKLIEKRRESYLCSENNNNNAVEEEEEGEDDDGRPRDLLGLLIQAGIGMRRNSGSNCSISSSSSRNWESTNSSSSKNSNITVQDIIEECKSFFFAGKQTTSNLLTWTTVLLAMHPHWQALAREEVLRVCGSRDAPLKYDNIGKLKLLSMIINESLRLYPPAIATIRRAKCDVELGGYRVPRGTELLVPILAVHHDQAIWGSDANEFNPLRFADGVARAAKHPVAFIPFGLGIRTCIGQTLAILQAKLVLATILQRFSFGLAPSYQHAPTVLILLYPQHGAPIIFKHLSDPTPQDQDQGY